MLMVNQVIMFYHSNLKCKIKVTLMKRVQMRDAVTVIGQSVPAAHHVKRCVANA